MIKRKSFHLHLVSDSTGETILSVARACLVQYHSVEATEHFWNMVRSGHQLDMVIEDIDQNRGVVVYTLVDEQLRQRLQEACIDLGVPCVSVLDQTMAAFSQHLGMRSDRRVGGQHLLNAAYFHRMEAMDFAIAHDDGQSTYNLHDADIVLVGVSRTSKTPTSLYLANRGLKCANVPLVPGVALPPELDLVTHPLIVGLTNDPERLVQIRRNRMQMLQHSTRTDYVDPDVVRDEVREARRLFSRKGWPVIDVTRRAIEETAAEILTLLARRPEKSEPTPTST